MGIELLWLLPVVALGVFIFLVVYLLQKRPLDSNGSDLSRQVKQFNSGAHHFSSTPEKPVKELEKRLSELENSITYITQSISHQQKSIDRFVDNGHARSEDAAELKRNLAELHREYDVILSENYSLRSRLRKLLSEENDQKKESQGKKSLRLFEDTRFLNPSNFDDTAEIDISKMG